VFYRENRQSTVLKDQYKIYQNLKLLNEEYNRAFGRFMIPAMKVTFGSYPAVALLGVIRLWSTGNLLICLTLGVVCVVTLVFQLVLYPQAADIHELSLQYCRHLRAFTPGREKSDMLLLKYMKLFSVKVGAFYELKKETSLFYVYIIINYTIIVLLG